MIGPTDRPNPAAPPRSRSLAVATMALALLAGSRPASGGFGGPADSLLELVAPDSGLVLVVENLREQSRRVADSPLWADLKRWPVVTRWLVSTRSQRFREATVEIQKALGVPLTTLGDRVFGDALVLATSPDPADPARAPRGIMLVRPRDPAMLRRFVRLRNTSLGRAGGTPRRLQALWDGQAYTACRFDKSPGLSNYFVFLDAETFAWSNSERLIRDVIDRKHGKSRGLGGSSPFERLRSGLPNSSLLQVFATPASVRVAAGRLLRSIPSIPNIDLPAGPGYVDAISNVGFAVEWGDGLAIHSTELVDPARLPGSTLDWLRSPRRANPLLGSVPPHAIAVVSGSFDRSGLAAWLAAPGPRPRPRSGPTRSADEVVQDPWSDEGWDLWVLARVAPEFLGVVSAEGPGPMTPSLTVAGSVGWSTPWAGSVEWSDLALVVTSRWAAWRVIEPLAGSRRAVGFERSGSSARWSVDRVVGRNLSMQLDPDRATVACRFDARPPGNVPGPNPGLLQAAAAHLRPDAFFAVVDVASLVELVEGQRPTVVRWLAAGANRPARDVDRDLDGLLWLARRFKLVVSTARVSDDGSEVRRSTRLIAR